MRRAIWKQQTVYAKLAIVNRIPKITAIAPIVAPLTIPFGNALIDPIPNKATLQTRKLTKRLPVFIKRAQAVAHRMSIFTQDEGAVFLRQTDPIFQRIFWNRWMRLMLINRAYIGQTISVAAVLAPPPSYCTGRDGSRCFVH